MFVGNTAPSAGAVFLAGGTLHSCTFVANDSPDGSATYVTSSADIANCVITGGVHGAPVSLRAGAALAVACTDVAGNDAGDWVGALAGLDGVAR